MAHIMFEDIRLAIDKSAVRGILDKTERIIVVVPDKVAASMARDWLLSPGAWARSSLKGRPIFRYRNGATIRIFHAKGLLAGRFLPFATKLTTYIEAGKLDSRYLESPERRHMVSAACGM